MTSFDKCTLINVFDILILPWAVITKQSDTFVIFYMFFHMKMCAAANFTDIPFGSGLVPGITNPIIVN